MTECEFCGEDTTTFAIKTQGEVFNLCWKCFEYQESSFNAIIV